MDVLQTNSFWADVASTENIFFIAADGNNTVTIMLDLNTTHGFA